MGNLRPAENDQYSGYITVGASTKPSIRYRTGNNERLWLGATTVASGHTMVAIMRLYNTSIATATGVTTATSWADLQINSAILTMQVSNQNTIPLTGYNFAIGRKLLNGDTGYTSSLPSSYQPTPGVNANSMDWLNAAPQINNVSATSGDGTKSTKVTFDLTPLFKKLNDSLSDQYIVLPNTATFFMYIWHTPQDNSYNHGFATIETYRPILAITGQPAQTVQYYVNDTVGWKTCVMTYYP